MVDLNTQTPITPVPNTPVLSSPDQPINPNKEQVTNNQPPKKKIIIIGIMIIGVILLVIVGLITFYLQIWRPNRLNQTQGKFKPNDQIISGEVKTKMTDVKTMHMDANISLTRLWEAGDRQSNLNRTLKLNQNADLTDSKIPKSAGRFDSRSNSSLDNSESYISGENITIGETDYFKFTQFSSPAPFLDYILPSTSKDLSQIKDQWVEIDELMWHRLQKDGFWGPSDIPEGQTTTITILRDLFTKSLIKKELPEEKFGTKETKHYIVNLNRENAERLLREVYYIENPEDYKRNKKDEELEKEIGEFFNQLGEINGEIWIGKDDLLIYQAKIDAETTRKMAEGTKEKVSLIKFGLDLDFSQFGQKLFIGSPESSEKLEDVEAFSYWAFSNPSVRRDALRFDNLYEILEEMRSYKNEFGKFPQSEKMPTSIENLDPVPIDPGSGPCPGPYQWIPNTTSPQKFVIYACMENGKFYMIYEGGGQNMDNRPPGLNAK